MYMRLASKCQLKEAQQKTLCSVVWVYVTHCHRHKVSKPATAFRAKLNPQHPRQPTFQPNSLDVPIRAIPVCVCIHQPPTMTSLLYNVSSIKWPCSVFPTFS